MQRIGVFDSGVGGLSVVKSLVEERLFDEITYYGDTARVPYGIRDQNTIIRYALEAVEFFKNFDIELLIVACNTVSAYALEEMRQASDFEIIGVVVAGINAIERNQIGKDDDILILGTEATISSNAYQNALKSRGYTNIHAKATGLFVSIVEEGLYSGEILDATLTHYLSECGTPDAIILGCTHFPLIREPISTFFNNKSSIIHSGEAIAQDLKDQFLLTKKDAKTSLKFFASQNPDGLKKVAKMWL